MMNSKNKKGANKKRFKDKALKDNKGVSVVIGYVLLVVIAIVMSAIIFQWLRTYIPTVRIECPDGASIFIKEVTYDDSTKMMNITLWNNGLFNLEGYYIHIKNDSSQKQAIISIAHFHNESGGLMGDEKAYVRFSEIVDNSFTPGGEILHSFDFTDSNLGSPYSVRIMPMRIQKRNERKIFVTCGDARVEREFS